MKNLFVLSALFLSTISTYGQEKAIDSTIVKQTYMKTEHTIKIDSITYFVYKYKTGEYFTRMENKKTGRKYWQPLEKTETKSDEGKGNDKQQ